MHTGIISFCDRIAFNIKCSEAKDWILDILEKKYQIRILQKHWFRLDEQQFQYVLKIPHVACLRSNGNPYFLYFTKYEDVPQVMYIDKKVQPGYQKPRIILTKGQFDEEIFSNTLVEGEMVKDKRGQWVFLINDMLMYKGKYLREMPLLERLEHAYDLLQNHYRSDPVMDVCTYHVKKYVPCTQSALESLLELSEKLPYTNRGIYFTPLSLKYKPKLINFNDDLIKTVVRKVKDNPEFMHLGSPTHTQPIIQHIPPPPVRPQRPTHLAENEKLLWLRKTEQPDVYDLYEMENSLQKVGIAAVSTLSESKMLRAVFKNLNVATSICFRCRQETSGKWVAVEKM